MIPDPVKHILTGEYLSMLGTRSAELVPQAHRTWALRCIDDDHVTVIVPHFSLGHLHENLADSKQVALFVGDPVSHQSYQLKGEVTRAVEPTTADLAMFEAYVERLGGSWSQRYGLPPEVVAMAVGRPAVALTLRVREAFLQTPGPEAGRRIFPEVSP